MPGNIFYKQYRSPIITIVPTRDYCHPCPPTGSEQTAVPVTSSATLNCEQKSPVNCDIGEQPPSVSNLESVNTKAVDGSSTLQIPEYFRDSPIMYQNTKSTEASSCNMNQSIKELSTSKGKSRNNLVDLTEFAVNGVQKDLRSRLSRKRKETSLLHNHEPKKHRLDRENLMITFEQDVETDSTKSSKLAPTLYEPEPKKSKPTELTKYESSGADDCHQDPPEDLSFLDYIYEHADEFIDACYGNPNSQVERNKIIMTRNNTKSELIKKISENDNENSEATNPKKSQTNDDNMKSIQEKREETSLHKVMEINSVNKPNGNDSTNNEENKSKEDLNNYYSMKNIAILHDEETSLQKNQVNDIHDINYNKNKPKQGFIINITLEISSTDDTNKHKHVKHMDQNSQIDGNSQQEANNIIDLTGETYEDNASKEATNLCKDKHNHITNLDANNTIDLTVKAYEENASVETMALCKDKPRISKNAIYVINTVKEANNKAVLTEKVYEKNAAKEKIDLCKDKHNHITNLDTNNLIDLTGKPHEENASEETMAFCKDKLRISTNAIYEINTVKETNNIADLEENVYEKNTSQETIELCNDKTKTITDSKYEINTKQEANKTTDLTEKAFKDIASDETIAPCEDIKDIIKNAIYEINYIKEANDITDLNEKRYEENASKETIDICKNKPNIITNAKYDINVMQEANNIKDCTEKAYEQIALEETIASCEDKKKIMNAIYEINTKQEANKITDLTEKACKENASEETIAPFEDKINIITNAIYEINSIKEANNTTDLTEKAYEENASKETIDIYPDKPNIIMNSKYEINSMREANNITDLTEKACEEYAAKETIDICKDKPNIITNAKYEIYTKQEANNITDLTVKAYEENASKETIAPCEDKNNIITNAIYEINTKQVPYNKVEDKSDNSQNPKETVEASFETIYNNLEQNGNKTSTDEVEELVTAIYNEFIDTVTKSNIENQATSLETVKYNSQKLETIEDTVLKTNIEVANKDSELSKKSEIVTNTKKEEKHIISNNCLVPSGTKDTDEATMSDFISLETRMSEYFQKKYTVSSVIQYGRYSTIYKCYNTKGETYAVKAVLNRHKGKFMETIFSLLQRNQPRQDSCILYLMNAFEHQGKWCLLTEYYPYDLKLALFLNKRGFHIDQVQVLARQLVDAVNMLTYAGVTHSDIKPNHVLLNGPRSRLKLCGFDRSNYSSSMRITPASGTLSYRAPEVILGFMDHRRIDVWSTALVIFEMATSKILFPGHFNNEILEQQLRTFGSIDWSMVQKSKYRFRTANLPGASFKRQVGYNGHKETLLILPLDRNDSLRTKLFQSYNQQWARSRSKFQITKDMNKLGTLQTVLEKMLVLNPRHRLPIHHVDNSEFMNLR